MRLSNITTALVTVATVGLVIACGSPQSPAPAGQLQPPTATAPAGNPILPATPATSGPPALRPTDQDPPQPTEAAVSDAINAMATAIIEQTPSASSPTGAAASTAQQEAQPDALVATFDAAELGCMPTQPATDAELFKAISLAENQYNNEYINCLNDDHQFAVYLAHTSPTEFIDEVSLETHRCIWNGLQPMLKYQPDPNDPNGQIQQFTPAAFIAPLAVMAYCVTDDSTMAELDELGTKTEREYLRCVVRQQGGPREFVTIAIGDPANFEASLAAAEAHCAGVTPTPTPPA